MRTTLLRTPLGSQAAGIELARNADSQPDRPHGRSLLELQLLTSAEALASSQSTPLPDFHSNSFRQAGQPGTILLLKGEETAPTPGKLCWWRNWEQTPISV